MIWQTVLICEMILGKNSLLEACVSYKSAAKGP